MVFVIALIVVVPLFIADLEFRRLGWRLDAIQAGATSKAIFKDDGIQVTLRFDDSEIAAYVQEQERKFLARLGFFDPRSAGKKKKLIVQIEDENCGLI